MQQHGACKCAHTTTQRPQPSHVQDALSKAQHFAASGDTDKARSHWQFADEVAVQGLALKVYGQERAVEAASSRHELHRMQARVRQRCGQPVASNALCAGSMYVVRM